MIHPKFLGSDKWFSYIDHLVEETVKKKKKFGRDWLRATNL